jgi:hypothetical protein
MLYKRMIASYDLFILGQMALNIRFEWLFKRFKVVVCY